VARARKRPLVTSLLTLKPSISVYMEMLGWLHTSSLGGMTKAYVCEPEPSAG